MKMKKIFFILVCLFSITQITFAEGELTRKAFDLKLAVDNDRFYTTRLSESPFVTKDNTVQMYPGEDLFFEVEVVEDKIVKLIAVKENKFPEKTLEISFKQECNDKVHELMMLSIKNPFDKDLNYKALIYLMEHKKWVSTSVLPVVAGKVSFETWPDIIVTIALTNWTLKKPVK